MRRMLLEWNTIRKESALKAQALVEFSLTLLVFLLLMFMIIEIGHLMFSWIVVNNAARAGARYAITGDYMPDYGQDALFGWGDPYAGTNDDPFLNIKPCWPLFSDDEALLQRGGKFIPTTPQVFQYYRNARTCSVEHTTLESMRGLSLNPNATYYQNNFYDIQVMAANERVEDDTQITRYLPSDHAWYSLYPALHEVTANADTVAGGDAEMDPAIYPIGYDPIVLGYAGRPQEYVVVRVYYRKPILTPILNGIVPNIMLVGTTQMTNEPFGSSGVQREAILPPELPAVPTPGNILPPDLIVTDVSPVGFPPMPLEGIPYDLDFNVTIQNIGQSAVGSGYPFLIRLYLVPSATIVDENAVSETGSWPTGTVPLSTITVDGLLQGQDETILMENVPLDAGTLIESEYTVYAYVDSSGVTDEAGLVGSPEYNIDRERNNIRQMEEYHITVGASVDLSVDIVPNDLTPRSGQPLIYSVTVSNALSPNYDAANVALNMTLETGLELVSVDDAACTYTPGDAEPVDCIWPTLGSGANRTIQVAVVPTLSGASLTASALVSSSTPVVEPLADDADSETLVIDSVDVAVTKTVTAGPASPTIGDIITFAVDVVNLEDNPTGEVVVTDVISTSYDFQTGSETVTAGAAVFDAGSRTLTWTIPAGVGTTPERLTFDAEIVTSDDPDNTATSAFPSPDIDPTNNEDTYTGSISEVDIRLYKYVNDTVVAPGQIIQYTFEASVRTGDPDAINAVISDVLPASVTYYNGTPPAGIATCTPTVSPSSYDGGYNSGSDTWTINGDLPAGTTVTFTICGQVGSGLANGTSINNTASIDAAQYDPAPANNDRDLGSANPLATVVVSRAADLGVTAQVTVGGSPVTTLMQGNVMTLTLTVTNDSGSEAPTTNAQLANAISAALVAAFDGTPNVTVSQGTLNTGTLTWDIGVLAPGASATGTVTGTIGVIASDIDASFTPAVSDSGTTDPYAANNSVTVPLTLIVASEMVDADFDSGLDGFVYSDDAFGYTSNSNAKAWDTQESGAICVYVGYNGGTASNVSGGYTATFILPAAVDVSFSMDYRMYMPWPYESHEYLETWAAIDGNFMGTPSSQLSGSIDYIDRLQGGTGSTQNPGWQTYTESPVSLSAGLHTLTIGAYNNGSSGSDEIGWVCFDNVKIEEYEPIIDTGFDSNSDGFTYHDNVFDYQGNLGTSNGDASGNWDSSYGYSGGGLMVRLEGNSTDTSGAWRTTFTLTETRHVTFSFNYRITETNADNGEEAWLLVRLNGTYYGVEVGGFAVDYVHHLNNASVGWTNTTVDLGTLTPGTYTFEVGGYIDRLNNNNKRYIFYLDDFLVN